MKSVAKPVFKQSGGHVRIHSTPGEGCRVQLYVPRSNGTVPPLPRPAAASGDAQEPLQRARDGEVVLLVEDNPEVRRFGAAALARLGYRVIEAADGPAALRALESAPSPRPALLFTDVVLPGGMDGRTLADEVCRRFPALPVLFTSGYTGSASLDPGALVPEPRLLAKPYTLERLARSVRDAIDAAGGASD